MYCRLVQHSSLNSRAPKLKIFAKLKDIWINSRASHLNSIILHLKLKDFLSKLKYFSAKLKEFAAKLKISANLFAPDGGQTLKKQAWTKCAKIGQNNDGNSKPVLLGNTRKFRLN